MLDFVVGSIFNLKACGECTHIYEASQAGKREQRMPGVTVCKTHFEVTHNTDLYSSSQAAYSIDS